MRRESLDKITFSFLLLLLIPSCSWGFSLSMPQGANVNLGPHLESGSLESFSIDSFWQVDSYKYSAELGWGYSGFAAERPLFLHQPKGIRIKTGLYWGMHAGRPDQATLRVSMPWKRHGSKGQFFVSGNFPWHGPTRASVRLGMTHQTPLKNWVSLYSKHSLGWPLHQAAVRHYHLKHQIGLMFFPAGKVIKHFKLGLQVQMRHSIEGSDETLRSRFGITGSLSL